jgi:DNA-binding transcriptional LysR family regulator
MKNEPSRFPLSTDDCELLLEFELCSSLQELSNRVMRDHSIVSRALKRLSEKFPVVEKKGGKWALTALGRKVNDASRAALAHQISTLNEQSTLNIGTNREFAVQVLAPGLKKIKELFPKTLISIHTFEQGTENALLQGHIDIGFDCDRPFAPEIAYKLSIDEPIIAVASRDFVRKFKGEIASENYLELPHLLCERLHPDKILSRSDNQLVIEGRFNDITTTRAVCLQGFGWALLPRYAIKEELKSGKLIPIAQNNFGKSKYGVWWLRSRSHLKEDCEKLTAWLSKQEL